MMARTSNMKPELSTRGWGPIFVRPAVTLGGRARRGRRRGADAASFPWAVVVFALAVTGASAQSPCNPSFDDWTNHVYSNDLDRIDAGPGGVLWMGTNGGGVLDYDIAADLFGKHTRVGQCLPENVIEDLAVNPRNGDVWVATQRGAAFRPASTQPDGAWQWFDADNSPLATSNVMAVAIDHDDAVWIGTFDAGLYRYDGVAWTHFDPSNSGLSDTFVTSIEVDLQGNKWIGVWGDGVDRFDGTTWSNFDPGNTVSALPCEKTCAAARTCHPLRLGLISSFVWVLGVDSVTGDVWFKNDDDGSCNGNGVTRFDGSAWSTYTTDNSGLLSDEVNGVDIGPDGVVYFASAGQSSALDGSSWISFATVSADDVRVVGTDVWWATEGLLQWDGSRFTGFFPNGLADNVVADIEYDPTIDEVWASTRQGAASWDGTLWNPLDTSSLPSDDVRVVMRASNGDLWIGMGAPGGAARWNGVTWDQWGTSTPGFCCSTITSIEEDHLGRVWASWSIGGTSRWDGTSWTLITTANSGLPNTAVRDILRASNDDMWFATPAGTSRLDPAGVWTTFTTDDDLVDDRGQALAEDHDGNIWIATLNGISAFDGASFTNHVGNGTDDTRSLAVDGIGRVWAGIRDTGSLRYDGANWTTFTFEDGLASERFSFASFGDHPSGTVWMGTEGGVSVYEQAAAGGAPGTVPSGGGTPLTAERGPGAGEVTLAWGASCSGGATDYAVYRGDLGDFASHVPETCSTGGTLGVTFTPPAGDLYFLVTALSGDSEGSYGFDGGGAERPASPAPCVATFAPDPCP